MTHWFHVAEVSRGFSRDSAGIDGPFDFPQFLSGDVKLHFLSKIHMVNQWKSSVNVPKWLLIILTHDIWQEFSRNRRPLRSRSFSARRCRCRYRCQIVSFWAFLGPLVGPKHRFPYVFLAIFTFGPICVKIPILKRIVAAHLLDPNF